MEFKEYFFERKVWATNTIKSADIAKTIIQKILSKELTLIPPNNTTTIPLHYHDLKIVLKAFNNYKDKDREGSNALFFPSEVGKSPVIMVFVFEVFKQIVSNRFRGKDINRLNHLLYRFVETNNVATLSATLQHELQHAFEHDTFIDNKNSFVDKYTAHTEKEKGHEDEKPNKDLDAFEEYANTDTELYAKIVELAGKINHRWQRDLMDGTWLMKNGSEQKILSVFTKTKQIMNHHIFFNFLTTRNKKRFLKGLYTTVKMLWDYYFEKANLDTRGNINEVDIGNFLAKQKI